MLDLGAMANPMFKGKGANIVADKFDAHFPLKVSKAPVQVSSSCVLCVTPIIYTH